MCPSEKSEGSFPVILLNEICWCHSPEPRCNGYRKYQSGHFASISAWRSLAANAGPSGMLQWPSTRFSGVFQQTPAPKLETLFSTWLHCCSSRDALPAASVLRPSAFLRRLPSHVIIEPELI